MTDITKPPIHVWPFHDAPQAYRDMSPHGGDEDWIALIPDLHNWLDQAFEEGIDPL